MQAALSEDLRQTIYEALDAVEPARRHACHWVMNSEWLLECRMVTDDGGYPLFVPSWSIDGPERILGLPVEVRADGGVPHLEGASDGAAAG